MQNGLPRILVIELGHLVDLCCAVPALHLLREAHPNAQLDVLVASPGRDFLKAQSYLDRVYEFGSGEGTRLKAARYWAQIMREGRYDVVFDLSASLFSALVTWRSGAPERHGFAAGRGRRGVYRAYNRPFRPGPELVNRADANLRLCGEFCGISRPSDFGFLTDADDAEEAEKFFEAVVEGGKAVVGIALALHGQPDEREAFFRVAQRMARDGRFDVVLLPTQPDRSIEFVEGDPARTGAAALPKFGAFSQCLPALDFFDFVITNSILFGWMARLQGVGLFAVEGAEGWAEQGPLGHYQRIPWRSDAEALADDIESRLVQALGAKLAAS
jgi:ADP-heptose:LPS heptosyltransferase